MEQDKVYSLNNLNDALEGFKFNFRSDADHGYRGNYYCGITHDLDERQSGHRTPDYVFTVKCDSFEAAKELEKMLHDEGFDTGKKPGVGRNDSVFVYMYKKIPGLTNESIEA